MTADEIRRHFAAVRIWTRGDERAPHKPLLLLYALGRLQRGEGRLVPYSAVDEDLRRLLVEYGPSRSAYHPEYPFGRLRNDGVWELVGAETAAARASNTDPKRSELLRLDVQGGFPAEVANTLVATPGLVEDLAHDLLITTFPESIHEEVLEAVGLTLQSRLAGAARRARDPAFRARILTIYGQRCALCGYAVRLGDALIGVEAAHIKWHQAGGPDSDDNGIAMCALHHRLFDRGAFTVECESLRVLVSEHAHPTGADGADVVVRLHGREMMAPQRPDSRPRVEFLQWHRLEVFRDGPRCVA